MHKKTYKKIIRKIFITFSSRLNIRQLTDNSFYNVDDNVNFVSNVNNYLHFLRLFININIFINDFYHLSSIVLKL